MIPNIYTLSMIDKGFVQLNNPTLIVGDKVKLIFEDKEGLYEVIEVKENGFQVAGTATNGKVFIYGKEVDDFHTVDYEALTTLNISATQALVKQFNQLTTEVDELKKDMSTIKAAISSKNIVVDSYK